jgi:C-terminal processing protease CtpA/Prc
MNYVANTDALIIDLRNNNGSMNEDAVPFICSYLFEEPVHLNDIYWRTDGTTRQFWTYSQVTGKKYLNKPVYILTSTKTFSGAEEFAYDLQQLKRAKIIGEKTRGGANPGGTRRVNEHFSLWLPTGRAINPITKTNWDGVGVIPDFTVQATKALNTAYLEALESIVQKSNDEDWNKQLNKIIAEAAQKQKDFKTIAFNLKGHTGAKQVFIVGDFNFWSTRINKMDRTSDGWIAQVELPPGQYAYRFVIDDMKTVDPDNPKSIITVE